jgi:copper transport protein
MKALRLLTTLCFALLATGAQAHAHLKYSAPAEGAVVAASPASIVLRFSEAARMTALSIQKDQEPKQALKPPAGDAALEISVAIPPLAPGSYTLRWRVQSADDNHITGGELHFTVGPAQGAH